MAFWSRLFKDSVSPNPSPPRNPGHDIHARARRCRCTRDSDFSTPARVYTSRPLPTGHQSSPSSLVDVRLFRIFHPLLTPPRRPRLPLPIHSPSSEVSFQETSPIRTTMVQLFLRFLGFRGSSRTTDNGGEVLRGERRHTRLVWLPFWRQREANRIYEFLLTSLV